MMDSKKMSSAHAGAALTSVEARRQWDLFYGRRWSTSSSETWPGRCAWVRRGLGPMKSVRGAVLRELTGGLDAAEEALSSVASRGKMEERKTAHGTRRRVL
jgi:hypothetical protein